MAFGDFYMFEEFTLNLGNGVHNLGSDSFKIGLVTTLPVITLATPSFSDYTEVSGSNYTAGGVAVTSVWTEALGIGSFALTNAGPTASWTRHATGPTNVRAGILYNNTNAGKEAIGFIDYTVDGGVISLVDADITWDLLTSNDYLFQLGGQV